MRRSDFRNPQRILLHPMAYSELRKSLDPCALFSAGDEKRKEFMGVKIIVDCNYEYPSLIDADGNVVRDENGEPTPSVVVPGRTPPSTSP